MISEPAAHVLYDATRGSGICRPEVVVREDGGVLGRDLVNALNVALNESDLLGIDIDAATHIGSVWIRALTLTPDGREPPDRVVHFILHDVSRVAASLRAGPWDDMDAAVEPFAISDLSTVVRSFGGQPIYGWEFIDPPESNWSAWRERLSLDERFPDASTGVHLLEVFQEGEALDRHLDVRIWFSSLSISTELHPDVDPAEFAAGGVRWWDAMYAGDPVTHAHGVFPLRPSTSLVARAQYQKLRTFLGRLRRG